MALQRLARDHHNQHRPHLFIGDALAVILALSRSRSSSSWLQFSVQRRITSQLHSAKSHIDGGLATFPRHWRPPAVAEHVKTILITNVVGVGTCLLEQATEAGISAGSGTAQSESEASGREAAFSVRDFACKEPGFGF